MVRLSHYLDAFEAQHGIESGRTKILPVATETPEALFQMGGFARCAGRLAALTWGAEDLSTAVGAMTNKQDDGNWSQPYQLARSLCLFGAHAAGVPAIDTLFADIRDAAGLRASCAAARRDGFSGKIAIHPDQVSVINECFTPSADELAHARRARAVRGESRRRHLGHGRTNAGHSAFAPGTAHRILGGTRRKLSLQRMRRAG